MARQAVKITYDDGTVQVIDPPDPVPAPAPPPPPPASKIIKGGYFDNIPDNRAKEFADKFGMGWARIWHTIKWDERIGPSHPTIVRADALQKQGLGVLVLCTPPEQTGKPAPTPQIAADYFLAAGKAANNGAYPNQNVFAWEIYNEPNLTNYNAEYPTSSTSWLRNALIPGYQALHSLGHFVVSGGWSEGTAGLPWMISNGLLANCDAVGYHPYATSVANHVANVKQMRGLIGDKPLWLTEWNLHMDKNAPDFWMASLQAAATQIAPLVQAVFHFRMVLKDQPAGVAAPLDLTCNPRPVWYDGTVKAMGAF